MLIFSTLIIKNLTIPNIVDVLYFIIILFVAINASKLVYSGYDIVASINLPILIPAMVILNPLWAGIVAFIGAIDVDEFKEFIWYKFFFNRIVFFIATISGAFVIKYTYHKTGLVISIFLGALTYFIIDNLLVHIVIRLSGVDSDSPLLVYLTQLFKSFMVSYVLGVIFYWGYSYMGKISLILAIILIYVLKDLIFSRIQQFNSFTQIVESFLKVIDSKDDYTEGHCERVAEYTRDICKEMDISIGRTERIVNMAKIHDIGKINVDDRILKSSELLTANEFQKMKKHSKYGYEILKDIDIMKTDLRIILHHHEHFDGKGYPEGLKGEDIPLGARILCVCDAFDVMSTGRSYKPALTKWQIIAELQNCSGKQFDPEIAAKMLELIDKGKFDDRLKIIPEEEKYMIRRKLQLKLNYSCDTGGMNNGVYRS